MSALNIHHKPDQFEPNAFKNNDPLAHVDLYITSSDIETANYRTYVEYLTDMGERLVEQPFKRSFEYAVVGDDFISDTGVYLNTFLKNGYQAAINDVEAGDFEVSHAQRAKAFYDQLPQLKKWFENADDTTHQVYFSLCAPTSELDPQEARKQGFKQERLMASVQLYEKTTTGIVLHAFSLDGLSLDKLGELFELLNTTATPAATTIEQLTKPLSIEASMSAPQAVESIIYHYDKMLANTSGLEYTQGVNEFKFLKEANSHVESRPVAYELYRQTVIEVAHSLKSGSVNARLGDILGELQFSIVAQDAAIPAELHLHKGQYFNRAMAGGVIDYLRTKAIPHYLTNQLYLDSGHYAATSPDSYQSVSDAGAQAVVENISYEGSCPTSGSLSLAQAELSALGDVFGRRSGLNPDSWVWTTGKCVVDNCPTRPSKTTVGPCNVCVGCQSIYDEGKDPKSLYKSKNKSIIEIFSELFTNNDLDVAA